MQCSNAWRGELIAFMHALVCRAATDAITKAAFATLGQAPPRKAGAVPLSEATNSYVQLDGRRAAPGRGSVTSAGCSATRGGQRRRWRCSRWQPILAMDTNIENLVLRT